jgi:Ran GTPase-activating protein (RanGAP) involved in mRNA processing and transport
MLTILNLTNYSIGSDEAKVLAEILSTNSTLTSLDLQKNLIDDDGAEALAKVFNTKSALNTLDLSNLISWKGFLDLFSVRSTNPTLTTLGWRDNLNDSTVQRFLEAFDIDSVLTTLNLEENSIGFEGAKALVRTLKTYPTLTTLGLKSNSIGPPVAKALAEALKTNSALTTLDLQRNLVRDEGADALAEALETNSALTTLT